MSAAASLGFAGRTLSERCLKRSSVICPFSHCRMPEDTTEGFRELGSGRRARFSLGKLRPRDRTGLA